MNSKITLSRSLHSDFPVPTPPGRELYSFQKAGVEYSTLCRNTLFADPPGVGKTIQSIGYMNWKGVGRALVLCPASLIPNWKRELERWHLLQSPIEIFSPKKFNPARSQRIVLMSYTMAGRLENVKKVLDWGQYELCVLDECQYLKNVRAKRTKYILAKNGIISKAVTVHALSGTPIVNRPMEIFPVVSRLCPEAIDHMDYFQFGLKYCDGFKGKWGWDFSGASNLPELGRKLRSHFMIRRPKADVLKELPDKFPPNLVYIQPDGKADAVVKRMAAFDAESVAGKNPKVDFEDLSAVRRELGVLKAAACSEYIKAQLDSGHEKIIVFAHHREVIQILNRELLSYGVAVVVGGMSAAEKDAAIQKFQNQKEPRIMLASINAAGVGHTMTAASYVIFAEFSWVPGENEQAVDRSHRIGQEHGVMTDYLVYEGSLDERVLKLNWQKNEVIREVMA